MTSPEIEHPKELKLTADKKASGEHMGDCHPLSVLAEPRYTTPREV